MKDLTKKERKEVKEAGRFDRIMYKDGGYYGLKEYNDAGHQVCRYGWIGNADECRHMYLGEEA